jgi:hypothetical protein
MHILIFTGLVIIFSFLLRGFYNFQRKFFVKSYYSFFELITGLPPNLTFYQLFFIKFIPPFLTTFAAYYLFNRIISLSFLWYSTIGVVASLMNTVPAIIDIKTYKGYDPDKNKLKKQLTSIYLIYFLYVTSFFLLSGLGAYFASLLINFNFTELLPSKQGIIDGIWIALIIAILNKLNKPL